MKSKGLKKPPPAKRVSLGSVLNENKKIKRTIKQAATELTSVNEVLKKTEEKINVPVSTIKVAIAQNENVEQKVEKAAADLKQVNAELTREVAERAIIESELAKARDDLSKSQAKEEETRQIYTQDVLTGLPNRISFDQGLEHGLTQAKRHGWLLAVLFIDIDKFKSINDSYGHDAGDKVLLMVANRLRSCIRGEDLVSRWGGDEFVCLLSDIKQEDDVTRIAGIMVNRISEAFKFKKTVLSIRASIGIAIYPEDGKTADILLKNADQAMYKAKGSDKQVVLFRESAFD
jgi:diguanylate cyclase